MKSIELARSRIVRQFCSRALSRELLAATTAALIPFMNSNAFAADSEPTALFIANDCSKTAGQLLIYAIREEVRKSSGLRLVDRPSQATAMLSVQCLNDTDSDNTARYAYLVSTYDRALPYPYALAHGVGACGRDVAEGCAKSMVATVDSAIAEARNISSK